MNLKELDSRLNELRRLVKKSFRSTVNHIIENEDIDFCIFCGDRENITSEHVIPKWAFNHDPTRFFITPTNGKAHKYQAKDVPACANCNNNRLGYLDKFLKMAFSDGTFPSNHDVIDMDNIIRWLEFIDYKFQVLDFKLKFLSGPNGNYIPYLAPLPIAMLRQNLATPTKVYKQLRLAAQRLTIKNKLKRRNSLIIMTSKNPGFDFKHTSGDFIFIDMPYFNAAIFYFYEREFSAHSQGAEEAMKLIQKLYEDK